MKIKDFMNVVESTANVLLDYETPSRRRDRIKIPGVGIDYDKDQIFPFEDVDEIYALDMGLARQGYDDNGNSAIIIII